MGLIDVLSVVPLLVALYVIERAAKPRAAQLFSQRPLLGRWSSPAVSSMAGPGRLIRDCRPPSRGTPLSSHLHAAVPVFSMLGAIDPAPDPEAFSLGLETMVFTALVVLASVLVIAWVLKMLRSVR